ncbi:MAG: MBL fold metallo-hydrolase [Gemmatimonadaceae bacterium]
MTSTKLPAHHAPNGRFQNPWPNSGTAGLGRALRWGLTRNFQRLAPTPMRGSLPTAASRPERPRADVGVNTATWIGHSTVLVQMGGVNVITDPVFAARASPFTTLGPRRVMDAGMALDELPPLDVVLLSHNHYDHLDRASTQRLAATTAATWVVPLKLGATLKHWGVQRVVELDWWERAEVCGLDITATPARHFSGRSLTDRFASLWCGYAVASSTARAYFVGDTAYHPEFRQVGERCGPFGFVMMPIGAYDPRWMMRSVHLDPEEAVRAYVDVSEPHDAKPLMLGIHWGTFRLTDEDMEEPPQRVRRRWQELELDPEHLWIAGFGETRRWA